MTEDLYQFADWILTNQALLVQYAINIVVSIAIFIVGTMVARAVSRTVERVTLARGLDATITHFLAALVRYGVLAFTVIAVLGRMGVQTTSVIAVLGAAGLAIALALQGSLSNFAAGVLLVVLRPMKAGEYVSVAGTAGTVDHVHIFSTTLRTVDNKTVTVPNGKSIADNIVNNSREPLRRVDITVGVAYSADIDAVKHVLGNVIAADARILHDKGVTVRLNEMAASSLNFVTRAWTTNEVYWDVYFDLMENFKRALDANGIGIPYPQLDVHLHHAKPAASD